MAELRSCKALTAAHFDAALASKAAAKKLLGEIAKVARPNEGAPNVLPFIARLAAPELGWFDGRLCVDLIAENGRTNLLVLEDLGGVRELAFPRIVIDAPLTEFDQHIRAAPDALLPLEVDPKHTSASRISLVDRGAVRTSKLPTFDVAEESIRRTQPPPARAKSTRPRMAEAFPTLEIPRASKVLDFGDFDAAKKAAPPRPVKKPPPAK